MGTLKMRLLVGTLLVGLSACGPGGPPKITKDLPTAAKDGDLGQIRAHIYWKADLNRKNVNGDNATPLFLATQWGHTDAALLLLNAGADPNAPSQINGEACCIYPLHVVKSFDLARALIAHGESVTVADGDGVTPVEMAIWPVGNLDIVKLEVAHGANVNPPLRSGALAPILSVALDPHPDTALVHYLLAHGVSPNVQTGTGWTLLNVARDAEGRGRAPGLTALVQSYLTNQPGR